MFQNMLDVLQRIGERDIGRRPNTPVVPHHNNKLSIYLCCAVYITIYYFRKTRTEG